MLRGDNIVCGTSTTGTGTLTLAATPVPPGGVDFDVFARATGIGFGNSAAILVSYTIIEYTDSTFAKALQTEKGVGTLTLGSSSGIANATLARTTLQTSATSLNSQPATQNIAPGTGVSIGTAANTLVFIGSSVTEAVAWSPYVETSGDNLGASPLRANNTLGNSPTLTSGQDWYFPFVWSVPMLVKRASLNVGTAYTGGTPVSNAYARIYDINTGGRPGKLLYDFGLIGSANASINSTGNVSTGASGNGYFLTPGIYFFDFLVSFSGGSSSPVLKAAPSSAHLLTGNMGTSGLIPVCGATANSGTAGAAPDPANLTSYSLSTNNGLQLAFALAPN
jgi:hypothetical protein